MDEHVFFRTILEISPWTKIALMRYIIWPGHLVSCLIDARFLGPKEDLLSNTNWSNSPQDPHSPPNVL
jgi:hypothetical protein